MGRAVLSDCLPWLALLVLSCAGLWLVVRANRGGFHFRRLLFLHRNESGSAQSLSFVLTLPIFIVILLVIVQVSQLMIGTIMVHYAAFAAARAAIVWVPAGVGSRLSWTMAENCVDGYSVDPSAPEQVFPNLIQPSQGGLTYIVTLSGLKYQKIASAAYMACMPICPSRNLGLTLPQGGSQIEAALKDVYHTLAGRSPTTQRMTNKLAYAMRYTNVDIRFYHSNSSSWEPPLVPWGIRYEGDRQPGDGADEYWMWQELGWQDPITVTVTHYLALLPGPGRILANKVSFIRSASDRVQGQIEQDTQQAQPPSGVYVYKLTASCTLGNEGEKSVMPYEYQPY
jgi:hypothetical protein